MNICALAEGMAKVHRMRSSGILQVLQAIPGPTWQLHKWDQEYGSLQILPCESAWVWDSFPGHYNDPTVPHALRHTYHPCSWRYDIS